MALFPFDFHPIGIRDRQYFVLDEQHDQALRSKNRQMIARGSDFLDRSLVIDGQDEAPLHGDCDGRAFADPKAFGRELREELDLGQIGYPNLFQDAICQSRLEALKLFGVVRRYFSADVISDKEFVRR